MPFVGYHFFSVNPEPGAKIDKKIPRQGIKIDKKFLNRLRQFDEKQIGLEHA